MDHVSKNANDLAFNKEVSLQRRILWALLAILLGVLIAGFWNYHLADGFGRNVVADGIIGPTQGLTFTAKGLAFGFLYAATAGLASTFTACNCVVFSMLPGLSCQTDVAQSRPNALRTLLFFVIGVLAVCSCYGVYVVSLGDHVQTYNTSTVRLHQARITFSVLGSVLLVWSWFTFGFLDKFVKTIPLAVKRFVISKPFQATAMGLIAGFFAVGRPYPVFREFLAFAVSSGNDWFGALAMAVQGFFQTIVMLIVYLLVMRFFGNRLAQWATNRPQQLKVISSFALAAGGAYFIYYWGVAMQWNMGSWGFKLHWYS